MAAAAQRFRFNAKIPNAEKAAREFSSRFVTRISESTRAGIRAVISRSVRGEITPQQAADLIRPMVGLTGPQAGAVMNYRARLEAGGLTGAGLDRSVLRYSTGLLRSRALTIARTEVMGSLNAGAQETMLQAQDAGLIPQNAEKEWIAAVDAVPPPCQTCLDLHGQRVPVGDAWELEEETMGVTALLAPPAHPNCRCLSRVVATGE